MDIILHFCQLILINLTQCTFNGTFGLPLLFIRLLLFLWICVRWHWNWQGYNDLRWTAEVKQIIKTGICVNSFPAEHGDAV